MYDICPRKEMGLESHRLEGTSRIPVVQDTAKSQTSQSRCFRAMFSCILKISQPPEVLVPVFEQCCSSLFEHLFQC